MASGSQPFVALTWTELLEALEPICAEFGLRHAEVTDLVQGQVLLEDPELARHMSRVIELRAPRTGAVAYLRTGIPVGQEAATLEAGPFLLALRLFDPASRDYLYYKYPRVKRIPNWRQNLRRRVRDLVDEMQAALPPGRQGTHSLPDVITPEQDDLERDLTPPAPPEPFWTPARIGLPLSALPAGDTGPEAVSLPVWMSAVASLALILMLLLRR